MRVLELFLLFKENNIRMASGSAKMNGVGDQEVHELEVIMLRLKKLRNQVIMKTQFTALYCNVIYQNALMEDIEELKRKYLEATHKLKVGQKWNGRTDKDVGLFPTKKRKINC